MNLKDTSIDAYVAQLDLEIEVQERIIHALVEAMPASVDTLADQLMTEQVEQLIHAATDRRRDLQLTLRSFR